MLSLTETSKTNNDIVNGTYDLSWAKELELQRIPPFSCDVLVEDGDVFSFGKTSSFTRAHRGRVIFLLIA